MQTAFYSPLIACAIIDFGRFWTKYSCLKGEKSILPYFSMFRGVAVLDSEHHSQAGSTTPPVVESPP